ncbi:MAG: hypothetical protein QME81_12550, partial [bacterium]|nr:hypothetical protein [bacterium]
CGLLGRFAKSLFMTVLSICGLCGLCGLYPDWAELAQTINKADFQIHNPQSAILLLPHPLHNDPKISKKAIKDINCGMM